MKWNLDNIYTGFESIEYKNDFKLLKEKINNIIESLDLFNIEIIDDEFKYQFEIIIVKYEEIYRLYNRISCFIFLNLSCNVNNKIAKNQEVIFNNLGTMLSLINSKITKLIGNRENIDKLILKSDILKEYTFLIKELENDYKYILSDEFEEIISELNNYGANSFSGMQSFLVGDFKVDYFDGKEKREIPLTEARSLLESCDKNVRDNAFKSEKQAYKYMKGPVSYALNNIKKSVVFSCKKRGYESPLEMSLQDSRIKKETLESLISAMEESLPMFQEFLKLKAKLLGDKSGKIKYSDLFAPLYKSDTVVDFNFSMDFINKNFGSFSKELGDFSKKVFDNNWVDSEIYDGKIGGAFCDNVVSIKESRILMSYGDSYDSLFTLAHELGHAYHGEVLKNEKILNTNYPMPIAETASIFCETLIADKAFESSSEKDKILILEYDLNSAAQVIVDIYSRFLFEKEVFDRCENEFLSSDDLNDIMKRAQIKAYGNSMNDEYFPEAWIYKSHYYNYDYNFYNFPYAFGLLFSLGLYKIYLSEGDSFIHKYKEILRNSGKGYLEDICKIVSIDITNKKFFMDSIDIIKVKFEKFKELVKNI